MRKLFFALFLLCPSALLAQQLTHVFGTVTDPSGLVYRNGRITATLVISNTPFFVGTGQPYTPPSEPTRINDDGFFEMTLANVNQLTPAGATWSFHVCSDRGTVQPGSAINKGPVCFDVTGVVVTGASMDLSATLSAAAPRLVQKEIEGGGTATTINGITLPGNTINWVGTLGPPPVCLTPTPTNGRCISFLVSASNVSAYLIGDGSTNCLSGLGTYVTCGGGTGGGVGAGIIGQLAGYVTTSSVTGQDFFYSLGSTPPTLSTGTGGIGIATGGIPQFNGGVGTGWVRLTSINSAGGTAISTPSIALVNPGTTPPTLPANAFGLNFLPGAASAGVTNVAAFLQGDGVATHCLIGTGIFAVCPASGSAGVTSINGTAGAFSFTGTGVSCATTTCTFTAGTGGGGLGGSGTAGYFPIFTNSTTLGNGPQQTTFSSGHAATIINVDASTGQPLQPVANVGVGISTGVELEVTASIPTCSGSAATPGTTVGCSGQHVYYGQNDGTSSGVNAAVFGRNIGSGVGLPGGLLNIGVMGFTSTQITQPEERAGYFEANDTSLDTGSTTTRRGVMGVANNASTRVTALNEGVVAQTGAANSTNTQDFSMHCLAPVVTGTGAFTTHACVKIEPQLTGVEFQTGAHTFVSLPACTSTYEGSLAAITDSSATSGTITGGGTNHVLGFCNGTAWTVSGGGGGGGGGAGLSQVCAIPSTIAFATNTGNLNFCTFTLPATAHSYIVRCVAQMDVTPGITQNTDADLGVTLTQAPATATKFMSTYRDPGANNIFLQDNLLNAATGNQNLTTHTVSGNVTSVSETADGVLNVNGTAQTVQFYVGMSLAGATGNLLAGSYCKLD